MKMMENEKDIDLNHQMIQLLGIFGATKQLEKLSERYTDEESRRALMQALAISGDSKVLMKMIEKRNPY